MLFLRIFQHLLPDAEAWRFAFAKQLRKFFEGLSGAPTDAVQFVDDVYGDLSPETTRALNEWERDFGLTLTDTTSDPAVTAGRLALAAEWAAVGGQSPSYYQGVLQTAGFPLYVHEWWSSGPPYVARDPRLYTTQPLIGIYQCTGDGEPSQPQCSSFDTQPQCNGFLANDPGYLVNLDLTRRPPPYVPDDPDTWPFFIYLSGDPSDIDAPVFVAATRRAELERLLLKLRPTQNWIVTSRIDYGDGTGDLWLTEGGDFIITEGGDFFEIE